MNVYSGISLESFDSIDGYMFCAENFVVVMLCILADAFFMVLTLLVYEILGDFIFVTSVYVTFGQ